MKKIFLFLAIIPMFLLGSCEKELLNPNAATSEDVLNSVDGLLGMVVGLKRSFSVGATSTIYAMVSANGMTTKELFVINTGNADLASLEAGAQTLNNNNSFVRNIWENCNIVNTNSQILIDNVDNISDAATANTVLAYAHLFKALAIGTLAQFFEQVPVQTSTSSDFLAGKFATFVPRAQALQEAISLLEAAAALNVTPSALFNSKVGTDISINNALQALLARYYNMVGNNDKALEAAGKVDLASKSIFKYDVLNQNPVFRTSLVNNNTYNGVFNFGLTGELAPDPADGRIVFYLADNPATNVKVQGFFKSDTDAIPFYLPGEMLLIRAEAFARKGQIVEAITELDKVLTKTNDAYGVNAKLQAYSGAQTAEAVLLEIYKNRCIELYMTGLKLEDSRRFGRPGAPSSERSRNFYPYPINERDNNPNTPADPQI
ncbi:MAG: RagB/SusD family nutrient uptake outer membrane protein [Saprospiraceae bacterium]|nr:RagB/SusD family nutrient uptake outer membrane protein [Saprospiraceae bacterium]